MANAVEAGTKPSKYAIVSLVSRPSDVQSALYPEAHPYCRSCRAPLALGDAIDHLIFSLVSQLSLTAYSAGATSPLAAASGSCRSAVPRLRSGFRVQDLGSRVAGSGFGVWDRRRFETLRFEMHRDVARSYRKIDSILKL